MPSRRTKSAAEQVVHIIGVPMDHGAGRRGVGMGPSALRIAGLHDKLRAAGREFEDHGDIPVRAPERKPIDVKLAVRANHLGVVARTCDLLHEHIKRIVKKEGLPLVIGGDHSIAIGTIAGLVAGYRQADKDARLGLIWIDAHGDLNTPQTSPSGNIHGMPVAVCLGDGPKELTEIGGPSPKLEANDIVMVGLRDLDPREKQEILDCGVHAFTMKDIDERGMAAVMRDVINLATRNTDYLHVSFDIDSVDPRIAPGTGTTVFGGLTYREAHLALEMIAESGTMSSLEMVEVNPILDVHNQTADMATGLIASALGQTIL